MKKYKAIIFDYDGVLAESNEIKTDAFRQIFKDEEFEKVDKFVKYHKENEGVSRVEKIKFFYKSILKNKILKKNIEIKAKEFSNIVQKKIVKCEKVKGSNEFLKKNFKKINLFISTGTPEEEIIRILKKTNIYDLFKTVLGSPNTKKQHISFILKNNNLSPKEVVFIGDSKTDYCAAKSFDMDFILRSHKFNTGLSKNFKGHKFNNFYELEQLIKI